MTNLKQLLEDDKLYSMLYLILGELQLMLNFAPGINDLLISQVDGIFLNPLVMVSDLSFSNGYITSMACAAYQRIFF